MEKPSPEIRDFSKEHSNEERLETAKEIKALRREHFAEKQDVGGKINNLIDDIENKAIDLEQAEQEVADLRHELQGYTDFKVRAFFGYFKKRSIEKELDSKAPQEIKIKEDCEELLSLLYDLQEQFFDRSRLDVAKNKLREFYGDQKELLEKYKHDEEVRDVGNVIKKHNCLFVHGIQTRDTPDYNTLITDGVDWETKIKIALSLDPTLSTSTVMRGDNMGAYWSDVGLLLKGGRVETAEARDNGTVAKSIKKRGLAGEFINNEPIEKAVDRAIHSRQNDGRYNEITVAEPIPAGLYLAYESFKMREGGLRAMHDPEPGMSGERLYKMARDTGLPVYLVVDGTPYEAIYDEKKKIYNKGKELSPFDILENSAEIKKEDKDRMLEGIFENSPFNRVPNEVILAQSFQYGRKFYIELMHKSMQGYGIEATYKDERPGYGSFIPEGAHIVDLGSIANAGFTTRCVSYKGELYEDVSFLRERRNAVGYKFIHKKVEDDDLSRTYIECSMGSIGGEKPIQNVDDYTLVMADSLKHYEKIKEERLTGKRLDLVEYREKLLSTIVSHIYGFAKQAEVVGDVETKEKVLKLVEGIMSMDQLAEITSRRLGPNGEVKITLEDLP